MKICYLIDKRYYNLTKKSISYIKAFYKSQEPLEIYLFHFGDLNDIEVNEDFKLIEIEKKDYPFFIHRCFLFDAFDEKIIFIDSDTVCQTNIKKLHDIDLEGNIFGVAQHIDLKTHKIAFTNYTPTEGMKKYVKYDDYPFFNAGVMLVDCEKWHKGNFTDKVLSFFETYRGEKYDWNDEVAFNLLLGRHHSKFIDQRWNYNNYDKRPFIVHYYGDVKQLD
jgi:lipopolysaccharide biosynthesis glycosyltransferase